MKVITIKQPFASLIMNGIKCYEFRTWRTHFRGDILIHAGKGKDLKAMKRYEKYNLDYPQGCILGIVTISDCIEVTDEVRKNLRKENELVYGHVINDKEWKGYAFKLENPRFIDPIEINGKLSLWDYEYEKVSK